MTTPYSWTVEVVTDPDTGELMLPFPPDLLNQMGWSEGTDLSWIDNANGSFTIKKKEETTCCACKDRV